MPMQCSSNPITDRLQKLFSKTDMNHMQQYKEHGRIHSDITGTECKLHMERTATRTQGLRQELMSV